MVRPTIRGRVWKFGDWISGDDGILRFSELRNFADDHDPAMLAQMCFAPILPGFAQQVTAGDVVVAGRGFAIPSHPPAPRALLACGIAAVVVESTDSAFIRRSLNAGLPVLTAPGITDLVAQGDELAVDLATGTVSRPDTGQSLDTKPWVDPMLDVIEAGGLEPYLKAYLAQENQQV